MTTFKKKVPYDSQLRNGFVLPDRKSYLGRCLAKTDMVTRGIVESAYCDNLVFITLTYDPEHLPLTYKDVKDLPIFRQRKTRKKYPIYQDGKFVHKWFEKNSRPVDVGNNDFRTKDIINEYDFKNARMRARDRWHLDSDDPHLGLLVPEHLSIFLRFLRDELRKYKNDDKFHIRFIANGEYGEHNSRPHYHVVIFDSSDFNYTDFVYRCWDLGRVLQVKRVSKTTNAVKKLTAYIVGHTAKHDSGNQYQNELSPAFKLMSTYGGGIGSQLLDTTKIPNNDFVRSLMFSLSAWDKRTSLKYTRTQENPNGTTTTFVYEFPRYYKDKVLNYKSLPPREFYKSMCQMCTNLIKNFCQFANLHGEFDLLATFEYLPSFKGPAELLSFFLQSNYKKIPKSFLENENLFIFVALFLENLSAIDEDAKKAYKAKYSRRHQEQKYLDYLDKNHFNNL